MGLSMRHQLFYGVDSEQIYNAFQEFYVRKGKTLIKSQHSNYGKSTKSHLYDLHVPQAGWVLSDCGTEWPLADAEKLTAFVTGKLKCSGFFLYVCDGDYWAYSLFHAGSKTDCFVQEVETSEGRPPGADAGNAGLISAQLPWLTTDDLEPYLVQENWDDPVERNRLDVPPRHGDEYTRFDELSILNFYRLLGTSVELRRQKEPPFFGGVVTFLAPLHCQFWVEQASV